MSYKMILDMIFLRVIGVTAWFVLLFIIGELVCVFLNTLFHILRLLRTTKRDHSFSVLRRASVRVCVWFPLMSLFLSNEQG